MPSVPAPPVPTERVEAPAAAPGRPGRWRALLPIAVAAACFAGTSLALRAFVPWPDKDRLRPKAEHLVARAGDYDLVFFGSSRVFRGFDVAAFERRLAQGGVELRAFNFGVSGMQSFETDRVLRRVLEQARPRWRHVLIEFPEFSPEFLRDDRAMTDRSVAWHDARETLAAIDAARLHGGSLLERASLAIDHARLGIAYAFDFGLATFALRRALGFDAPPAGTAGMLAGGGFEDVAAFLRPEAINARQREFRAPGCRIVEDLAPRIARRNREPFDVATYPLRALRAQVAAVRAAGAEPIYVTMPCTGSFAAARALALAGELPALIALCDPEAHPDLFATRLFFDDDHLNVEGARRTSEALADALGPRLRKARGE